MNGPAVSNVSNAELRTVRDAMRELNRMVALLERGELDKFILTHRDQMRAVVVSLDPIHPARARCGGRSGLNGRWSHSSNGFVKRP